VKNISLAQQANPFHLLALKSIIHSRVINDRTTHTHRRTCISAFYMMSLHSIGRWNRMPKFDTEH